MAQHRRRVLCLSLLSAIGLWIAISLPAQAVLWTRILIAPPTPRQDEPIRLTVFTFELKDQRCWNDPAASPIPIDVTKWTSTGGLPSVQLEAWALGPRSEVLEIRLSPRSSNHAYWDGQVSFPSPGKWRLSIGFVGQPRLEHPSQAAICSGYSRLLEVLPAGAPETPIVRCSNTIGLLATFLAGAILVAMALTLAMWRLAKRT